VGAASKLENAPDPSNATKMPKRLSTQAIKTRMLKKADFEVDVFFMVRSRLVPFGRNPRQRLKC
jgi:hypothetical protein